MITPRAGLAGLSCLVAAAAFAAEPPPPAAILEDLKAFNTMGTVLHIAAHPDDENTTFLTVMAKGRRFRTAYLSVTRGDGGQNEIGPEFDAELGIARTQELLAARRIDGARQFFTRAMDFGYSKSLEETLRIWERDQVLGDVVRVIRTFRPDVIVNNFIAGPQPGNHGHHNASAVLGLEAFRLAGDPAAYPEQLADGLTPWQPKRIMQGPGPTPLTGTDPVTGDTFAALAGRSRAMHYTQFGIPGTNPGRGGGGGPPPLNPAQTTALEQILGPANPATAALNEAANRLLTASLSEPANREAIVSATQELAAAHLAAALARADRFQALQASTNRLTPPQVVQVAAGAFANPAAPAPAGPAAVAGGRGAGGGGGGRGGGATFNVLAGDPATSDLMEGVDTTWNRVPGGGADIGQAMDAIVAAYNPQDPSASVTALLALRTKVQALPKDPLLDEKKADLDRIIAACAGLTFETTIANAEVVPGEMLRLSHSALVRSAVPVRWTSIRYPNAGNTRAPGPNFMTQNQAAARNGTVALPANTRISQPYWLRELPSAGLFTVGEIDRKLIGQPENPSAFPVVYGFDIGGQAIELTTEPVQITRTAAGAERRRRVDVIAPVTVHFTSLVKILAPGASGPVEVELTANRADASGTLQLDLPAGWRATPATQNFRLGAAGTKSKFTFNVTAPAQPGSVNLGAHVTVGGQPFNTDRAVIDYAHLPFQLLQPQAMTKGVSVNLAIKGRRIGYFPGAGDDVAECLEQMGYTVTQLTGADLNPAKLQGLDAVVIGVRAFDEKPDLAANFTGLLAWVEAGGTVIAQYNRSGGTPRFGPYMLNLAGGAPARRTTDENAPVTFLAPQHPALTTPNRIDQQDFANWVQERGTYYPSAWDTARYTPILGFTDPGEQENAGALLVAQHGRGYYVYSGVAFFRQLPKGVPGAYRLFANLVSLGK